jgi:hypothetical protein
MDLKGPYKKAGIPLHEHVGQSSNINAIEKLWMPMWYGYTVAPGDPLFRAALHDSGIDGEIST